MVRAPKWGVYGRGQRAEEARKLFSLYFGKPFAVGGLALCCLFTTSVRDQQTDTCRPDLPSEDLKPPWPPCRNTWTETHYKYLLQPHYVQSSARPFRKTRGRSSHGSPFLQIGELGSRSQWDNPTTTTTTR